MITIIKLSLTKAILLVYSQLFIQLIKSYQQFYLKGIQNSFLVLPDQFKLDERNIIFQYAFGECFFVTNPLIRQIFNTEIDVDKKNDFNLFAQYITELNVFVISSILEVKIFQGQDLSNLIISYKVNEVVNNQNKNPQTIMYFRDQKIIFIQNRKYYMILDVLQNYKQVGFQKDLEVMNKITEDNALLGYAISDLFQIKTCLFDILLQKEISCYENSSPEELLPSALAYDLIILKGQYLFEVQDYVQYIRNMQLQVLWTNKSDGAIYTSKCNDILQTCVQLDSNGVIYLIKFQNVEQGIVKLTKFSYNSILSRPKIEFSVQNSCIIVAYERDLNVQMFCESIGTHDIYNTKVVQLDSPIVKYFKYSELNNLFIYLTEKGEIKLQSLIKLPNQVNIVNTIKLQKSDNMELNDDCFQIYQEKELLVISIGKIVNFIDIYKSQLINLIVLNNKALNLFVDKERNILHCFQLYNYQLFDIESVFYIGQPRKQPTKIKSYSILLDYTYLLQVDTQQDIVFLTDLQKDIDNINLGFRELRKLACKKNLKLINQGENKLGIQNVEIMTLSQNEEELDIILAFNNKIARIHYDIKEKILKQIPYSANFDSKTPPFNFYSHEVIVSGGYMIFFDYSQLKLKTLVYTDSGEVPKSSQNMLLEFKDIIALDRIYKQIEIIFQNGDKSILVIVESDNKLKIISLIDNQLIYNNYLLVPSSSSVFQIKKIYQCNKKLFIIVVSEDSLYILDVYNNLKVIDYQTIENGIQSIYIEQAYSIMYIVEDNGYSILLYDLDSSSFVNNKKLIKPSLRNVQVKVISTFITIFCYSQISFYNRSTKEYLLSYRYADKSYKIQDVKLALFDTMYVIAMDKAIRLIEIDIIAKQVYDINQIRADYTDLLRIDFTSRYNKFSMNLFSLKYGEYLKSSITLFYEEWVKKTSSERQKRSYNNFDQIRQKSKCAINYVMNTNELDNIIEEELLKLSSDTFNFAVEFMQVSIQAQARFQIPFLDKSFINQDGMSVRIQKYQNNLQQSSDYPQTEPTSNPPDQIDSTDQKHTLVLKQALNYAESKAVNFDNLIISFKYMQGKVITIDGNIYSKLQEIIFSSTDILTDIRNSTLYLKNLNRVVFHNVNFQNINTLETPTTGMGVITLENIGNIIIDGVRLTNITNFYGRGSFLRVFNCRNVQLSNLRFEDLNLSGYSAENLQNMDQQKIKSYLTYLIHLEDVENVQIQNLNITNCVWVNMYLLRGIRVSTELLFNNSYISYQQITVNQTLDSLVYAIDKNDAYQRCKINGLYSNQNVQQQPKEKIIDYSKNDNYDDIYKNYDLYTCLPQSFISFFESIFVQVENIEIESIQLDAVEFNFISYIKTNKIIQDRLTFSEIQQQQIINPPVCQAINVQGSQQFEISNSVFDRNSNVRFLFAPNLPISLAEVVQNQFVKLDTVYLRNSQHIGCLIEGSAYDNVIVNSSFFNLINRQSLAQIYQNKQNSELIYFTRSPYGAIGLYSFHSLLLKNSTLISCRAYYSAAIYVSQGYIVQFLSNKFEANIATASAGAVMIQNIISIVVNDCIFSLNKALESSGGALVVYTSQIQAFTNNIFQRNQAKKDSAGAIQLIQSDVKNFYGNQFINNLAAIGGCIRYFFTLPSFIDANKTYLKNNTFRNNIASLYGNNVASDPQGMAITLSNFNSSRKDNLTISQPSEGYRIKNQISGSFLSLPLNIILIDEEQQPILFPQALKLLINQNQQNSSSSKTPSEGGGDNSDNNFPLESDQVTQQFSSYQIQVTSDITMHIDESSIITNYNFDCQCYILNFSLASRPLTTSSFKVSTKNSYYIIDYTKNIPQFIYQPLSLTINVEFGNCLPGDILVYRESIILCQPCPSGKYTLADISSNIDYSKKQSELDQGYLQCKICPEEAISCEKNKINLKNGYWRLNDSTDQIYQCKDSSDSCLPEDTQSRNGCKIGYTGIYCAECDYRALVWDQPYGRFYNSECQICNQVNQWFNVTFMIITMALLFIYIYMQVNRQRKFAKKSCICYYLRKFNFILMGRSGLIDHGAVYTKIFINYLQIMFLLSMFKINTPVIQQIMQLLGGDPNQIIYGNLDCIIANATSLPIYVNKIIFSQLLPLILLALCFFILTIQKNISHRKKSIAPIKKYVTPTTRDLATQGLFIYLFSAPSFLVKIISYMCCSSTQSFSHLVGDNQYQCFSKEHQYYFYFFLLPLFILQAFVVPLLLMKKLYSNQKKLYLISIKYSYGFLYQEYTNKAYFWEFIKIYMKILIMVVVIVFHDDFSLRSVIVVFILFIYFLITLQANPYISRDLNYSDRLSNATIILTVIIDLFIKQSPSSSLIFKEIATICIYIVNFFFFLSILKRLVIKPLPFSYKKMNLFQKCIYHLKATFPTLFSFVQFQPQNPFNIFRNWKRLRFIISKFQEMRKSKNLFNDQFFKIFQQQSRSYRGTLNNLIDTDSQKDSVDRNEDYIRKRQVIHLSTLPCNISIQDSNQSPLISLYIQLNIISKIFNSLSLK